MELLCCETPDFIAPELKLPNSLDFNAVDYKIWEFGSAAG